jgi:hypothetical protein
MSLGQYCKQVSTVLLTFFQFWLNLKSRKQSFEAVNESLAVFFRELPFGQSN